MSRLFASGAQNIGASVSAPVLSMNIQGWFPLVLTGLISTVQAPSALLQMKWNGCRCKKSEGKSHSSVRILLWCGWWVSKAPPAVGIARQQNVRKVSIQVKGKVKVTQLCLTLCNLMDYTVHGKSPGQYTGVGSLSLLQGILPTQGSNPGLLHCRQILYQLSHNGSPRTLEWAVYPFSSTSTWPRN